MIKKINIIILNLNNNFNLKILKEKNIIINIFNLKNYEIIKLIFKINIILKIYEKNININIIFDDSCKSIKNIENIMLSFLNNILYKYNNNNLVKLHNCNSNSLQFMNELNLYKDISMNPNKNPKIYLDYILSRIHHIYKYDVLNVNESELFPLTKAVGIGSQYPGYFLHIYPKNINNNLKTIFLVGKAITFDSGGLNLKSKNMDEMKTDMIGSAIIVSVLNLITTKKYNIHVLAPIVENMISNTATRPGMVIKTLNNKTVEISDTDAEGRLCLVDCFNYIHLKLVKNLETSLIIDVATLTGNVEQITCGVSSICFSNSLGKPYLNKLINIGENIGEYIDTLEIRPQYLELLLDSPVADIKSLCLCRAGAATAAAFLKYFIDDKIAWIHMDVASSVFKDGKVLSYGVNLLNEFINSNSF